MTLYVNLAELLGTRIEQGFYRPGDRLPSVRALASSAALAHSGHAGHDSAMLAGLSHPLGGADHLLAMLLVGILWILHDPRLPNDALLALCAAALLCCSAAASAVGAVEAGSDFHVVAASADTQKYLTYGWNGWNGKTIHWRYNDSNRSTAAAGTADAALNAIRAAMGKWSAVCAITFVYDGTSSNGASLATNNTRDSVNVIAWSALESGVAGQTWVRDRKSVV